MGAPASHTVDIGFGPEYFCTPIGSTPSHAKKVDIAVNEAVHIVIGYLKPTSS